VDWRAFVFLSSVCPHQIVEWLVSAFHVSLRG